MATPQGAAPPPAPAPSAGVPLYKDPVILFIAGCSVVILIFLLWTIFTDKSSGSSGSSGSDVPRGPSGELPPTDKAPCDPACKCYSDVAPPKAYSPMALGTDTEYDQLQNKDNKTFCGFIKDSVRYGCEASCCSPACT